MSDPDLRDSNTPEAHVPWETLDAEESPCGTAGLGCVPPEAEDPSPNRFDLRSNTTRLSSSKSAEGDCATSPLPEGEGESPEEEDVPAIVGGGWTLPVLCAGVALIACSVLIPQADLNRRLAYERKQLEMDLQTVEKQIAVNDEFLKKVGQDPTLAERLAERQMKVIPQGSRVLELPHDAGAASMSPFQLVSVPPPAPLPAYKPIGGVIASLCYDAHSRIYVIGAALGLIATGLVLGGAPASRTT